MDTIEPPSFCPSLGFTAASTERTESVGVVRGLLLWPSSLRPSVCSFSVRAVCRSNQSTRLILANLSFLRWSGCSAWQCRCCRLLSPWLANLKRPPPQPCTPQVGRAELSRTSSSIYLFTPCPPNVLISQSVSSLGLSWTSNFTLVETFIVEHLLQQTVDESAPQPAQRTASNPSIDL